MVQGKIKLGLMTSALLIMVSLLIVKIQDSHSNYDRETMRYIELIKASYWASWRFGNEVLNLEIELIRTINHGAESPQDIIDRIDFLMVNYDFLTTDSNIFPVLKRFTNDSMSGLIATLDSQYVELTNEEDWTVLLPRVLETVDSIRSMYDNVVLYELKGYDLTAFVNQIKEDRQTLLYAIYIAIVFTAVIMTVITNMSKRLKEKSIILETDYLTGLKNRKYCITTLEDKITQGKQITFCFLDLNGFKNVNDTLGHDAGDQLLKVIASRASASIRKDDILTRLGGDEFGLIMNSVESNDIKLTLDRLMHVISQPIEIDEKIARVGCSIGIAVHHGGVSSAKDLMLAADSAMYKAKRRKNIHPNVYEFY